MGILITHGGKLPLDSCGWMGEKSFTRDLRFFTRLRFIDLVKITTANPNTGYDSIFSEYLMTDILFRNTVPSLQVSWDDLGQMHAGGCCRFFVGST